MVPKSILCAAISVNGRTTSLAVELRRFCGLAAGFAEDATPVGCDTLLKADVDISPDDGRELGPAAPAPKHRRTLLVVPDSRGRIKTWHVWRQQPFWRDCVALANRRTPAKHLHYFGHVGIQITVAGEGKVDLAAALSELERGFGVRTVLVDSGGTLNGVSLRCALASDFDWLVHPVLVGGEGVPTFLRETEACLPGYP